MPNYDQINSSILQQHYLQYIEKVEILRGQILTQSKKRGDNIYILERGKVIISQEFNFNVSKKSKKQQSIEKSDQDNSVGNITLSTIQNPDILGEEIICKTAVNKYKKNYEYDITCVSESAIFYKISKFVKKQYLFSLKYLSMFQFILFIGYVDLFSN
ncbi:Cyclic nucleotide-binding protein [Pseudocohnilembus persalinus]|uniref:Cyclic nucleotide-binding protein n=1 Tax=Pseudocohnilembus persalinus TaxID=266149 RepID=A0A0V0R5D7_PSEPJ|nr:Cyclic nucleotide-binding protein [Pseudocohnilembus persalinus]|eukprot:KRX09713.1 Cyclic nucleotide-binding protein [Pseudocohnilembus persalinus]